MAWMLEFGRRLSGRGLEVLTAPKLLAQLSKDYYWYSPILRTVLHDKIADCAVCARSETDVIAVAQTAAALRVPLTVRGAGTGNYGQAVPLRGGVVLDVSGLTGWSLHGSEITVGVGQRMGELEDGLAPLGKELRMFPSTVQSATIGGFVAGGSAGVGSVNFGVLRDPGNVLGARLITMEEEPRVLQLTGDDVVPSIHAYGTNGILTQLTMPVTLARHWYEVVATFPDFGAATRGGFALCSANQIHKRGITTLASPIHKLPGFNRLGHGYGDFVESQIAGAGAVNLMYLGVESLSAAKDIVQSHGGRVAWTRDVRDKSIKRRPLYEFGWNHTTLRALRRDSSITYLQCGYDPEKGADHVLKVHDALCHMKNDHEVMNHLEFVNFRGRVGVFGLPLVRYTSELRLNGIIAQFEALGAPVFNPHTFVLEDGGMKQTDMAQLEFKRANDPYGLLNPGKMRAFDAGQPGADILDYDRIRNGSATTAAGEVALSLEAIATLVAQADGDA